MWLQGAVKVPSIDADSVSLSPKINSHRSSKVVFSSSPVDTPEEHKRRSDRSDSTPSSPNINSHRGSKALFSSSPVDTPELRKRSILTQENNENKTAFASSSPQFMNSVKVEVQNIKNSENEINQLINDKNTEKSFTLDNKDDETSIKDILHYPSLNYKKIALNMNLQVKTGPSTDKCADDFIEEDDKNESGTNDNNLKPGRRISFSRQLSPGRKSSMNSPPGTGRKISFSSQLSPGRIQSEAIIDFQEDVDSSRNFFSKSPLSSRSSSVTEDARSMLRSKTNTPIRRGTVVDCQVLALARVENDLLNIQAQKQKINLDEDGEEQEEILEQEMLLNEQVRQLREEVMNNNHQVIDRDALDPNVDISGLDNETQV